jgi:CrcB protein
VSVALWIGIALVGGAGSLLRFGVAEWVAVRMTDTLPLGTLAVNLTGSLALGVLVGAGVGGDALLLTGTGLLGSYTTFSAWMVDTDLLGEEGASGTALANVVVSLVAGVALVALGRGIGGLF